MENITKEQFRELIIGMVIPFSLVIGINEWLYLRNENEAAYNVIENTDKIENYVDENPDGIFFIQEIHIKKLIRFEVTMQIY